MQSVQLNSILFFLLFLLHFVNSSQEHEISDNSHSTNKHSKQVLISFPLRNPSYPWFQNVRYRFPENLKDFSKGITNIRICVWQLQMTPELSFEIKVHGFLLWAAFGFLIPLGIPAIRMSNREQCERRLKTIFYIHACLQASFIRHVDFLIHLCSSITKKYYNISRQYLYRV